MKIGSFKRWLELHYPRVAFNTDGTISKAFVSKKYKKWSPKIQRKAVFFLNTVKKK